MSYRAAWEARGWEVPAYRETIFRARRSRYCVSVFVLDEGERIRAQMRAMRSLEDAVDVFIADGGSTDGATSEAACEAAGVTRLLVKRGAGGLSAQMRMALAVAMEAGYEGVIVVDGNGKDETSAVTRFVEKLSAGYDHVQGSRFVSGGRAVNNPWTRVAAIRCLHAPLLSRAAGFRYTDTTNGFRAYSRRMLVDGRVAPFREEFSRYELHYYLAIRAARLGYRVCEIPVTRSYPRGVATPTKIHGWRGNLKVLSTLMAACRGEFDPADAERAKDDAMTGLRRAA